MILALNLSQIGPPRRTIAPTFDDLPASQGSDDVAHVTRLNSAIVAALETGEAPAVGFVNEGTGPSWLPRWRVAKGLPSKLTAEPDPPTWVIDLYRRR